jgi:hypothetical protein
MIQYPETSALESKGRGVLDIPPARGITACVKGARRVPMAAAKKSPQFLLWKYLVFEKENLTCGLQTYSSLVRSPPS